MKTAIQQLIDEMIGDGCVSIHDDHKEIISYYIKKCEELLELEKRQIIDAYWAGLNGAINDYSECKDFGDKNTKVGGGAEKYYNDTFNQIAP
jgi:hypothetical protein